MVGWCVLLWGRVCGLTVVLCVEGFGGTSVTSLGKIFFAARVLEGLV